MDNQGELPTAVWSGSFRLFGVDVKCHTLSDGRRIIEVESMARLFEAMTTSAANAEGDMEGFSRWQKGRSV